MPLTILRAGHPPQTIGSSINASELLQAPWPGNGTERCSISGFTPGGTLTIQNDLKALGLGGYQFFAETDSGANSGSWELSNDGKTWSKLPGYFSSGTQPSSPRIYTEPYGNRVVMHQPAAFYRYTSDHGGTIGLANYLFKGPGAA